MIVLGSDDFSSRLSAALGFEYKEFERRIFSDKEVCPRIPSFSEKNILLVNRMKGDPNSCIIETYLMLKTLKRQGKNVFLFLPYFPYTRQETAYREGEPFSMEYIMEILSGAESVFTVTSHYERDKKFIEGPVKVYNINGFLPLIGHLKNMQIENAVVVAPDKEIEPLTKLAASELSAGHITIEKKRDLSTGEVETRGSINAEGKNVVIIDDIVSTGTTMANAARLAREAGAKNIICACVHAILSDNAEKTILEIADEFIATNTLDSPVSDVKIENYAAKEISSML